MMNNQALSRAAEIAARLKLNDKSVQNMFTIKICSSIIMIIDNKNT